MAIFCETKVLLLRTSRSVATALVPASLSALIGRLRDAHEELPALRVADFALDGSDDVRFDTFRLKPLSIRSFTRNI